MEKHDLFQGKSSGFFPRRKFKYLTSASLNWNDFAFSFFFSGRGMCGGVGISGHSKERRGRKSSFSNESIKAEVFGHVFENEAFDFRPRKSPLTIIVVGAFHILNLSRPIRTLLFIIIRKTYEFPYINPSNVNYTSLRLNGKSFLYPSSVFKFHF